jgi:TonB family protein
MKIFLMFSIAMLFEAEAEVFNSQETMSKGSGGNVYLQVLNDTLGYVANVRIDSSDHGGLKQSASNVVLGIRFAQSYVDGTNTTTWLPLIVRFDATSDSTKRTNYTVRMVRPPGDTVALDKGPTLAKVASPVYPKEALNKKLEARVVVEVLIDEYGSAKEAFVVETNNVIFNESALEVVGRFQFTSGIRNGQPAPAWVGIPIQFVLPKEK